MATLDVAKLNGYRRRFKLEVSGLGKIVCEVSDRVPGPSMAGREPERKAHAKTKAKRLVEIMNKEIESY
jgi:hypothetical protein